MPQDTRAQVRQVLIITLVLNVVVAASKIILGVLTGALAITADGFHSLTDSAGNVAGLVANALSHKPPDEQHPYGHRRFETLAALLIGGLLLLTAWEMIQGVVERLQADIEPEITPLVFVVLGITLLFNIGVSTYQIRAGQRLKSEILLADARNTRADVFVTLSVMISSFIVALTGWVWVDVLAALVVVLLIGRAAWEILQQTGQILVDTAPYSPQQITAPVMEIPQVRDVVRARSRGSLNAAHIDVDVQVAPEMTADQSHSVASAIRQRLQETLGDVAEIEVHFVPHHEQGRSPVLTARAYADARGLATHEVEISRDASGTLLEMHVEVPPGQTLAEAHEQVSLLEADVRQALPEIDRVVTHIEPAPQIEPEPEANQTPQAEAIQERARALLEEQYPQIDWHDLNARRAYDGYAMNLHAAMPPQMSVEAAHTIAESAEVLLRGQIPELSRVIIHTEPYET